MLRKSKKFLLPLILLSPTAEILAEPVTFEITATVYEINDPSNLLQNSVFAGDKITGTYTIDIATPDQDPDPEYGHYIFNSASSTQLGFDLLLNNLSLKSDPMAPEHMYEAITKNSYYGDHMGIISQVNIPLSSSSRVDDIFIDLYDSTGQAMTSDALSAQAPNVSAFEWHDIHVSGGDDFGSYYSLEATIDTIAASGSACQPGPSNPVTFNVSATVREVYDYDNVLGNAIQVGDIITGTYAFNTSTADSDPTPEYGRYEHQPGSGDYGFNLSAANYTLKTNTATDLFTIMIGDAGGELPWDNYSAEQYGVQIPFINNSIVDGLGIYIDDPSGNMVSGTSLTDVPPVLSGTGYQDLYISGMGPSTDYSTYFSVIADLNSITKVGGCEEQPDPVVVSPASGVFDGMQNFDAAIVMDAGLPPMVNMEATLNGFDITPELSSCFPGAPNSQNRQTFICPNFRSMLMPGSNTLHFTFTLADDRIVHHTVDWLLLGY